MANDFYTDFEFNSFNGDPISLGVVHSSGAVFYAVFTENSLDSLLKRGVVVDPWIIDNVFNNINKDPGPSQDSFGIRVFGETKTIQQELERFLKRCSTLPDSNSWDSLTIVTDWPDDVKYFAQLMVTGPGTMIDINHIKFEVVRVDAYPSSNKEYVQHNALADALALKLRLDELRQELVENSMSRLMKK